MTRLFLYSVCLLLIGLITGCEECKQEFKSGDNVVITLQNIQALVIDQADKPNLEGYCLVTVRTITGHLYNVHSVELTKAD